MVWRVFRSRFNEVSCCFQKLALLLAVLVSTLGCGQNMEPKLKAAKSLTILYMVKKDPKAAQSELVDKSLSISKRGDVEKVLSQLRVAGRPKHVFAALADACAVRFSYDDGTELHAKFLAGDSLQIADVGVISLSDSKFYEAICETIGKAERRKVDPLKEAGLR